MHRFKEILKAEEKKITAALRDEINRLDPVVRPLVLHLVNAGGKRIRPLMTVLTAGAFGCSDPMIYALGGAMELLHGATLMHDDVVDGAELRRGSPATHTVFGINRSILAGDVLLAACMRIVLRSRNFEIMESVALAAEKTAAGEVEELHNLRNPQLDFAGYLRIITGKTACLAACACEIGAMQAGAPPERSRAAAAFGLELGIAFQMVDDALDIAPQSVTGKPAGGDLREGKVTPMFHFYLETLSPRERPEFIEAFSSGSFSESALRSITSRMRERGCAERTRALASEHLLKAAEYLALVPEGQEREILRALIAHVRDRDY
ncbi:MAG: polyprenyl synthetase family protein [Deltaproteobacteria bacterium]|jgi:octaprenyl-diphosphate synthase|nr:polyprenyl synthetase family protein [Deltaproteobacteria bacterium]